MSRASSYERSRPSHFRSMSAQWSRTRSGSDFVGSHPRSTSSPSFMPSRSLSASLGSELTSTTSMRRRRARRSCRPGSRRPCQFEPVAIGRAGCMNTHRGFRASSVPIPGLSTPRSSSGTEDNQIGPVNVHPQECNAIDHQSLATASFGRSQRGWSQAAPHVPSKGRYVALWASDGRYGATTDWMFGHHWRYGLVAFNQRGC